MARDIFSKHIGGASELTVLASIKPDFVPCRTLISYSARLRLHLRVLDSLRRMGLEGRRAGVYTGPLDALRTLQYIRWTLIDNDTRMLLAVNFDRPFEPYIRRIVDIAGPLLDTILCHCEGFEGHSSDQGFHKFMEYATAHQAPVELFAASAPNLTVDDVDYFVEADRLVRDRRASPCVYPDTTEEMLAKHRFQRPEERLRESARNNPLALLDQGLNIVQTLYDFSHLFVDNAPDRRDDLLYYRLLQKLTPGFWGNLYGKLSKPKAEGGAGCCEVNRNEADTIDPHNLTSDQLAEINGMIKAKYEKFKDLFDCAGDLSALDNKLQMLHLLNRYQDALDWYSKLPEPRAQTFPTSYIAQNCSIQHGLLEKPEIFKKSSNNYSVACLVLLRVDDAVGGREFLKKMEDELWPSDCDKPQCNLSITYAGLRALKIDENLRTQLPGEFREGMAARAGILGDIDVNNPEEWVWPKCNWVLSNSKIKEGPGNAVLPDTIDIIVQLAKPWDDEVSAFSESHPLCADVERVANLVPGGVSLIAVEPMLRKYSEGDQKNFVGHLGFVDGVSQPHFRQPGEDDNGQYEVHNSERYDPKRKNGEVQQDLTLLGDLLLGHPAKADLDLSKGRNIRESPQEIKPYPDYANSPLRDGTFQVIRKLRIHKQAFEFPEYPHNVSGAPRIQEMMIGRKMSGQHLAKSETGPHRNDFNYAKDMDGLVVPLQSHIRRSNPREADTPRILRKGFSYGPFGDCDADRGLMFIAYNARIAEQFEVIQRWISGGNSTGISSYHGDPLLAPKRSESTRTFRYFNNGKLEHVTMPKTPPVVLQWGLYAFTPSRAGLKMLAKPCAGNHDQKTPVPPTDRLTSVDTNASRSQWRLAIEDIDDERREINNNIWREIRDGGGIVRADNYGVLVGSAKGVAQVLKNPDNAFSVREYWQRMKDSTGVLYLGYDPQPVRTASDETKDTHLDRCYRKAVKAENYEHESEPVNRFFNDKEPEMMFDQAFETATELLEKLPQDQRYVPNDKKKKGDVSLPSGRRVVSGRFSHDLIANLCVKWMGMPDGAGGVQTGGPEGDKPHCPIDLIRASFYVFWPHPSKSTQEGSRLRSAALRDAVRAYVKTKPEVPADTLMEKLWQHYNPQDDAQKDRIAETVVGVCSGFAGPTAGSFRSVLFDWIQTGLLWRLQHRLLLAASPKSYENTKKLLEPAILNSMAKRAAPDILHREVVSDTMIGSFPVKAGEKVVISLRSATEDAQTGNAETDKAEQRYYLFGGDFEKRLASEQPIHACPGQEMAMSTMMGAFAALMHFGEIRPEGPLSFRIR